MSSKIVIPKLFVLFILIFNSCAPPPPEAGFVLHESETTGIDFSNDLKLTLDLNIFNYMYYYNGGGVGSGDFNNDGLIDLFFTSNLEDNKMYLNEGGLKFKEITAQTGIFSDRGWSTGVSIVDINDDGMLDIYISQVGEFLNIKSNNQLFICEKIGDDGIPVYTEKSNEYGLDLIGFSTQAAFLDYDLDGDLDMFQMNHSLHANGTFGQHKDFQGTFHPLSGDKIFRNDNGKYVNVTENVGINSTVIGYGLGLAIGDVNLDGYPDIYIGNDFHENDYLYINQKDGTFKEELIEQVMHTSRFSMGVDIADLNNDAYSEIISLDMLPSDPYILKKSQGENPFDVFKFKLTYGYNYQYAKNNLQLNNGNNTFTEIATYSGVHATDWSWAPLFADFDNDGLKDLFVANGIPKRTNDIDYINFIATDDVHWKMRTGNMEEKDLSVIDRLPEIKLPNKFFLNSGQAKFEDLEKNISNDKPSYSNGAIYADLDNDGDYDLVTNNIDEKVFVYENTFNSGELKRDYLKVNLTGPKGNRNAIGSKIIVQKKDGQKIFNEKFPVRGFQSSMEGPILIGLGNKAEIASVTLIWPDNTFEELDFSQQNISVDYKPGLPQFDYEKFGKLENETVVAKDITSELNINIVHKENPFVEFNREFLIPHSTSTEGPALAIGDVNDDGLDDVFVGSSKWEKNSILIQNANGQFDRLEQPMMTLDSITEEVDAVFWDVDNNETLDLLIASGGNEFFANETYLQPKLFLNDGIGNFSPKADAFDSIFITASCVLPYDFTGDGNVDLFIGARAQPWAYGEIPKSYLLKNDGTGKFEDVTTQYSSELASIGMVMHGVWFDLDNDNDLDLILSIEWDNIYAFINEKDQFQKKALTNKKGLWNFSLPYDFDQDGDNDLIAGNLGLNSILKASPEQPVRMYYNDYDENGKKEQILTYYLQGKEIFFANKMELEKQMPQIKKKYLYAEDFAKATISEVLPSDKLETSRVFEVDYMANSVLVNDGKMNFTTQALPYDAQFTPYKTGVVMDANGDELPDVFLGGNYYDCNIQMGRYDGDYGTILINRGDCKFDVSQLNGLAIKGQIRKIKPLKVGDTNTFFVARNSESAMVVKFGDQEKPVN